MLYVKGTCLFFITDCAFIDDETTLILKLHNEACSSNFQQEQDSQDLHLLHINGTQGWVVSSTHDCLTTKIGCKRDLKPQFFARVNQQPAMHHPLLQNSRFWDEILWKLNPLDQLPFLHLFSNCHHHDFDLDIFQILESKLASLILYLSNLLLKLHIFCFNKLVCCWVWSIHFS